MTITEQIQSAVRTVIENFQGNQINIALSGGVDSIVLAHAASRVSHESLYCLHVNHGISDNAKKWESFCFEFCKQIGAKFKSKQFHLKGVNNLESVARDCRYEFFIENLSDGDVLLTAHHMDDQAETFLLRLMRGAGVDGLASMRPTRDLGNGILARPLLGYSKDELMAYAKENDLKWVEDESNQSSDYDRNFLRNEVLPLLRTRWGNASSSISKSASLCQLASEMNAEKANEWLKKLLTPRERKTYCK
ncbi:tRNA lysidine(34) synthetase TilS [Vibrio parahaemolyticus]|nr:tRNA lysidine(34) synthetase TilS [Vibrio parahaemolyticus]